MNWLKLLGFPGLVVGLAIVLPNVAQAQITAGGDGTLVSPNGSTIEITGGTQTGSNLFHSFGQFNVSAGQTANFVDPGVQNILGRVTGGNTSLINGVLQVTGGNANLYLMNPAGIIFGSGASLDVPGSFTATTANGIGFGGNWFNAIGSNDYASLIGNPTRFAFTMAQPGAIANAGNLGVGQGQRITLLGGTVINTGTLSAPEGRITVAAVPGEKLVSLSQDGSLLSLALPVETGTTINGLPFTPLSLPQLLAGGNLVNATGVTVEGDVVRLTGSGVAVPTEAGTAIVANVVDASGATGGTVHVLGDKVGLVGANVNASGTNGGGTVLVGGDYKGQGTVPNAQQTYVSADSVINVDALQNGDGGRTILWSDGTTQFYGNIHARGGTSSGNGGFVEVSGKENLAFDGQVDLSATTGQKGQLLLDPRSVYICEAVACLTPDGVDVNANGQLGDRQILMDDGLPAANFLITPATVATALSTGNVEIAARRDIRVKSPVTVSGNTNALSLTAPTVEIQSNITLDGGNLILQAIDSTPGLTNYSADRIIVSGSLNSGGGHIELTAPQITLNSDNPITAEGGNVVFQGPVIIASPNTVLSSTRFPFDGSPSSGSLRFTNTINNANAIANNLTLNASKTIQVDGVIGNVNPLGTLRIIGEQVSLKDINADTIDLSSAVNLTVEATQNLSSLRLPTTGRPGRMQLTTTGDLTLDTTIFGPNQVVLSGRDVTLTGIQWSFSDPNSDVTVIAQRDLRLQDRVEIFGTLNTDLKADRIDLTAGRNLTVQNVQLNSNQNMQLVAQSGVLEIQDANNRPTRVAANGDLTLQGGATIDLQALNDSRSFLFGNNSLTLRSDGAAIVNGRLLSNGDIAVQTTAGALGNLIYNPVSSEGILSANGNVSFGDYSGPSLKVEARGSITGGNITITEPNTALQGTDPEIAILANGQSVILRAGVGELQTLPNVLPDNLRLRNAPTLLPSRTINTTTFTATEPPSPTANISVGEIQATGVVLLSAPGTVQTGTIKTDVNLATSGNSPVTILSGSHVQTGDILAGESDVKISAGGNLQAGQINTAGFGNSSSVKLQAGGDIEINTIDTGSGGIDITAGGSFRAIGSFENSFFNSDIGFVNDPDLINYLTSLGFSQEDLINANVRIPTLQPRLSLISRPSEGLNGGLKSPIVIRYGDQTQTIADQAYTIEGAPSRLLILGDSNQPFRMGPVYNDNIVFVPNLESDRIENYNPVTNNFEFVLNQSRGLVYGTAEFPTGASGLAAGIAVGEGTDASLYGSFQGYAFTPTGTGTTTGGGTGTTTGGTGTTTGGGTGTTTGGGTGTTTGGGTGTTTGGGTGTTTDGGTNNPTNGGTGSPQEVSNSNFICAPSSAIASTSGVFNGSDRSGRATSAANVSSSSCNTLGGSSTGTSGATADDAQILKLLDGGVR